MSRIPIRVLFATAWLSAAPTTTMAAVSVTDGNGGIIVAWSRDHIVPIQGDADNDLFIQRLTDLDAQHPDVVRWGGEGVPLCTAPGKQDTVVLVSDGAGGAIAAWQDTRSGVPKVFVQRVNGEGVPQWASDGVAVCAAADEQRFPTIVSDGAGGAIVAWMDRRSGGETDIYAQRVDAGGALLWDANGVAVCVADGYQVGPTMVSADSGGAIVVWYSSGGGLDPGIYAARIGAEGGSRWLPDGVPVFTTPAVGPMVAVAPDVAGGAFVAGSRAGEVVVQRISPNGVLSWMPDGVVLGSGYYPPFGTFYGAVVRDSMGGAIVSWNGLAQRVDAAGIPQWTAGGVPVFDNPLLAYGPTFAASDGSNGALLIWRGQLQHVSSSGSVEWTPNGITLSSTFFGSRSPTLATDGAGGAVVTWYDAGDREGGIDLLGQAFDGAGVARWTLGGVPIALTGGRRRYPTVVSDGSGSAIVTWAEKRGLGYDILARKFGGSAETLWPIVTVCDQTGTQTTPLAAADGTGGIVIAWTDWRAGAADIYAQRIDAASGGRTWDLGGVPICTSPGTKTPRAIIPDGAGGSVVVWELGLEDEYRPLFVQRLNGDGAVQWSSQGIQVGFADRDEVAIAPDGTGGLVLAWTRTPVFAHPPKEVVARRVDGTGAFAWGTDPVVLRTLDWQYPSPSVLADESGGAFVSWNEGDFYSRYVHVQHLDGAGNPAWGIEGTTVTPSGGEMLDEALPKIVTDGAGGTIVVWTGAREVQAGPLNTLAQRTYAQRLDATGAALWDSGGVALHDSVLCCNFGDPRGSSVISDGEGGAIVAWRGGRPPGLGANLYAQRIDSTGTRKWANPGVTVSASTAAVLLPSMATDGAGGSYLYWQEARDTTTDDVFGLRVTGAGTIPPGWAPDGVTSVLASLVGIDVGSGRVRVTWQLADASARAVVQRSFGDGDWHWIGPASRTGSGRVEYEDRDVPAGRRIGYRLAIGPEGASGYAGEVWTEVPRLRLAIRAQSNPLARGPVAVRLSVPSTAPTIVEVLDVAGRRMVSRTLLDLAPGVHDVELETARGWAAGLYFIRLRQGAATAAANFVLLR